MVWTLHHSHPLPPGTRSPGLVMGYDKDGLWTALSPPEPVIHISGQLLAELHEAPPDFVTLECLYPVDYWLVSGLPHLHFGDIIRIRGDDIKIVYVVRSLVHMNPVVWEASWPD